MADREDGAPLGADAEIGIEGKASAPGASAESGSGNDVPHRSVWLPVLVPAAAKTATDDDGAVIDEWPAPLRLAARPDHKRGWTRWLGGRAAMIGIAASIGALAGGAAATGVGYVLAARDDGPPAEEVVAALRSSIGQLASEIKSLRDGVGESGRAATAGLASLEDRIEGAEAAQGALTAKIDGLSEDLSRKGAVAAAAVSPETTGSITRGKPPVARDWVLWRVQNGRALVQGNGGYFEVAPGSTLPGLGLVQRIVKQNGRWVVLTRNGMIVSRG
jgi:hypothetical protein